MTEKKLEKFSRQIKAAWKTFFTVTIKKIENFWQIYSQKVLHVL